MREIGIYVHIPFANKNAIIVILNLMRTKKS